MFYYILLNFLLFVDSYLCYVDLSNCLFHCGIRLTQKKKFIFEFVTNNNVRLYLYCIRDWFMWTLFLLLLQPMLVWPRTAMVLFVWPTRWDQPRVATAPSGGIEEPGKLAWLSNPSSTYYNIQPHNRLTGNQSLQANWPENLQTVQICPVVYKLHLDVLPIITPYFIWTFYQ